MKVADMHSDTVYELLKRRRMGEAISLLKNNLHMDLQKMKQADYLLQNFAMFVRILTRKQRQNTQFLKKRWKRTRI